MIVNIANINAIAITGLAFRFPGDLNEEDALWGALKQKRDLVTEVPSSRWATAELQHPKRSEPGRSITFSAGVLSRIEEFDAGFFGISPREAACLDPQQRLLLELSWEALENAGVPPSRLAGTDCAVYVGISSLDYGTRGLDDLASMSSHSMTGNTLSIAANRLSYFFDLRGPSVAIDTACSSSLVALHHACRALQNGEASAALVGGVNLLLHPYPFVGFTKASMLSADGRCKAFDASGNGYVRAEGGAVLLLKPLAQAQADGDDIKAVILATGVNADGARKTGITIPSRDGQAELMRSVLAKTGLSPQDVDFIEAHGTGTSVGDPIECAAIGAVYGQGRETPLPIGSIKANLGHMEAASGMAGLVKAILALQKRALPPQLHLETPNPHIDFAGLHLQPITEYHPLTKETPLVCGINSFGFGGANAHVLLREYRAEGRQAYEPETLPPLFLSARSDAALKNLASLYADLLRNSEPADYYDIAYAAAYRRDRLEKRLALHAPSSREVAEKLDLYAKGAFPEDVVLEDRLPQTGGVAFVYSGNGAQWVGMGLRLMAESEDFAAILSELDARMLPVAGFSLLAELQATGDDSRLDDTVIAQPLLFAIQVALTRLLKAQGIEPQAVAGHSVGEVAAAWACGAFDLDAAIRVIVARSQAQGQTRGTGRMAAVGLSQEDVQAVMTQLGTRDITIAGINGPKNVTLSGSLAELERIQAHLVAEGVFFRLLDLDYAFHSPQMDPIRDRLLASLAGLETRSRAETTFVSTVTGDVVDTHRLGAEYWWHNIREPVRFAQAMTRLSELGCRVFIEIGPHAILQRYIGECLNEAGVKGRVLPLLRKEADGLSSLLQTVLRAHLLAESPRLEVYFPQPGRHVRLPNYPWQRERHWHPRSSESLLSIERRRVHPLLGWRIPEAGHIWENTVDPMVVPWLADHKVGGAIVFPGAAYAEMALAAAREWLKTEALAIEEMDIVTPMVFNGEHARTLRFELNDRDGSFQIKSRQRLSQDAWTLHAVGRILQSVGGVPDVQVAAVVVGERVDGPTHYRLAATLGLDYGRTFQGLREAIVAGDVLHAELESLPEISGEDYLLHPAVLDVCYQSLVDFFRAQIDAGHGVALLPVKTGRLEYRRAGQPCRFRARIIRRSARSVLADFELLDAQDTLLARLSGCRFRAAPLASMTQEKVSHWGIKPWLRPHPGEGLISALPSTQALVDALRADMAVPVESRRRWFKEALPLFEALVLSFTFEAFQAIAREDDEALQTLMTTPDPYTRWLGHLLQHEGLLSTHEGRWQLAKSSDLPAAEDIWRTLAREHGDTLPHLVLLGRVGRHLPQLLQHPSERAAFVETLRRSPVAEILYQDDPAYAGIRQAIEHLLGHLAGDWPTHRRLRVLDIAAGPIDAPRTLLDALPEDRLDYVLALPKDMAERQQADESHAPNLVIATLDDDWQLSTATALPEKYDIVILRHTLHRAASPRAALNQVRRWLAAGGGLIVAERYPDWSADFWAGLTHDWWHEAADNETPYSSLAAATAWVELMREEGFEDMLDYHEPASEGLPEGSYLLIARTPAHEVAALPAPEPASWLFLVDASSQEPASHLATRLESRRQQIAMAPSLPQSLKGIDHIVYMQGWGDSPETVTARLAEILENVQAIAAEAAKTPRLWFVTRGGALASSLPDMVEPNPQQAAIWGFVRVVMNEYPAFTCTLIDLDCRDAFERLENELLHPDGTTEILLSDTGRYTLVMQEVSADEGHRRAAAGERFRLDFHLPGQLRNLTWLPQETPDLADQDVEVEVQATGLNFRDVMYLMGLLPDEAVEKGFAGASLGLEFAGIVSRIGAGVQSLKVGDRVMGFGSSCFASHVVTRADAVARIPEDWSFVAAASVPTVFFTVYYALKHLADLQAGERVLVHGAAGGVGIAAIQLAKHLGAEVFATAGSDEKRDFVRLLGADHVFDSRSLAFADDILAVTHGEGVDVVLNSLAGEAMRRSLAVLKPFGRFLELGKRDFFENTPIGLRPFKDNISYFGIDADQLLTGRPQLAARMFREVMSLFREGALTPLPCKVFPAERVVDAFRTMQQARHIGKVVISMADARPKVEQPATVPALRLGKDATWIITGGLSGFGLASAHWLAAHGAGHLVLVGRRGLDTPGAKEAIDDLTAQGIQVQVLACDIRDLDAVMRMIDHVRKTCPPIQGVLHAAAVFDDALIANLDGARMAAVLAPKFLGAWNLHQATLDIPLEYFVLYSSITTALGNPGQANYVAANAGLEGLAMLRQHLGLPATCISWGPIGDTGYLARNEVVRESLSQRLGRPPLATQQALDQLERILSQGQARIVANFDWNTLARLLPSATGERFSVLNRGLKNRGPTESDVDWRTLIAGKSPDEVVAIVKPMILQEVATILAIGVDRIDPARSLHDLGLDSLMAVELALGLERRFGIHLPTMMLNESPTVDKVTQRIVDQLLGGARERDDTVEALTRDMAMQHGEAVTAAELQQIAQDARTLQKQGVRLNS